MHEACAASGMQDPGAFLVRNTLEAAWEGFVRMPIFAMFLSFIGAITNVWISTSQRTALVAAYLIPFMFAVGAAALVHGFVLTGYSSTIRLGRIADNTGAAVKVGRVAHPHDSSFCRGLSSE